jgi:DNA-binding transcriptional regulator GbsR (MarR family)
MDRITTTFVDGLGTAAATSGILSQIEGRIFALLYLQEHPLSLDDIAAELEQSKSTISVNVRRLVDWHLVRRVPTSGSRKDHYEAATNFWRVMQEMMERRFRWCVRQVLATLNECERVLGDTERRAAAPIVEPRLAALEAFFTAIDTGFGAFAQGRPLDPEALKKVIPIALAPPAVRRRR